MSIQDVTQLEVWQEARALVTIVYKEVRKLPKDEEYAMSPQVRRAAVSIPANIAEGFGSFGPKARLRYYRMAQASIQELRCLAFVCEDLGMPGSWKDVRGRVEALARRLGRLCGVIQQSI